MSTRTPKQIKAEVAFRTLLTYAQMADKEGESVDYQIKELLCDLMHLSDEYSVDFGKELVNAKVLYAHDAVAEAEAKSIAKTE